MTLKCLFVLLILSFTSVFGQNDSFPLETVLQNGHSKFITCYAFSADGELIATGGYDQKVLLWEAKTSKIIRSFNRHIGSLRTIQFSKNSKRLLTVGSDNKAFIFQVNTGELLNEFELFDNKLWEGYFTADEKGIVLSDNKGVVKYVDIVSEREKILKKEYSAPISSLLKHPKKPHILSLKDYKFFNVLNVDSWDTIASLEIDKGRLLSYSPDGNYIAASSRKLFTNVYNTATYEQKYTLIANDTKCDGCNNMHEFSNDSKRILTVSSRAGAILWDLATGNKLRVYDTPKDNPVSVKFSDDDARFVINYGGDLHVYNTKTGKEEVSLSSKSIDYMKFSFSSDNKYFLFPGENGAVEKREANSGKVKRTFNGYLNLDRSDGMRFSYNNWGDMGILKYINRKRSAKFSPNNKYIALSHVDSTGILIDAYSGKIVQTFEGHSQLIIGINFSMSGEYIVTTSADRKVIVHNVKTGEIIKVLKGHGEVVFDAVFTADDNYIISSSWDGSMIIWDWRTGIGRYINFGTSSPYTVGISKNDLYISVGDLGSQLTSLEFDTGIKSKEFIGHNNITSGLVFDIENNLISSSWDGSVKVWDFKSATLIAKLKKFNGGVFSVAVNGKGTIAAGGADKDIRLWKYKNKETPKILKGHNSAITSLEFTNDGNTLLSCSEDGIIKIWDLIEGKEIYTRLQMTRSEWLATNSSGYFDGSKEALKNVNYVSGNKVLPVNSFFKKYYSPDLIKRINLGESFNDRGEIHQNIQSVPSVSFDLADSRSLAISEMDTIQNWDDESINLSLIIDNKGVAVSDVYIYNNAKLIFSEELKEDISFRGISSKKNTVNIPLTAGVNRIEVVAVNENGIESLPKELIIQRSGEVSRPNLYVLSVGINKYKNPSYNLDHAVSDAKAIRNLLKENGGDLFNEIIVYDLTNEKAVKEEVLNAFSELKEKMTMKDVFVFFYAGHGVLGSSSAAGKQDFFMVLHDITNLYGGPESLSSKGFSAKELFKASLEIKAQKQLYLIDACHSGGVLNSIAQRGSEREKIIAQLAKTSGTYFLTASQSQEYANESGYLNHGLFTYAILEILSNERAKEDYKITVGEIKSYVEQRVPALSEKYNGTSQYPTGYGFGQDFPLILIK